MNPILIVSALGAAGLALAMGGKKAHASESLAESQEMKALARPSTDMSQLIPTPAGQQPGVMSRALQEAIGKALSLLTVDSFGVIKGPVTAENVQAASGVVGRLRAEGWGDAANSLDVYVQRAGELVPAPALAETVPLPNNIPEIVRRRINNALKLERDPAKLQVMADVLLKYDQSPERDNLIAMLKAMILQLEGAIIAQAAAAKAAAVFTPEPAPVPAPLPAPVPPAPEPAPVPVAKTPAQQAAAAMCTHLRSLQKKHGMPGAKGKEDRDIVGRFQALAGISKVDGLAGAFTIAKAASLGQGSLPLVMIWSAGSSLKDVQQYRDTLRRLADQSAAQGYESLANELRIAAAYERGQGGVAQYGGPLT